MIRRLALGCLLLLATSPAGTQETAKEPPLSEVEAAGAPSPSDSLRPIPDGALSPRNASYSIDVRLDTEAKTLRGGQLLTWRNIGTAPVHNLPFHLYWNAWRNSRSTWLLEDRLRGRSDIDEDETREEDWGWIRVRSARLLGQDGSDSVDLSPGLRFESPDDGNPDDRTVLVVPLGRPVEPGETVRVGLDWESRIPRTFARTGRRGDFYFFAHWFPKVGVLEEDGWSCHQFHAATEFYSDYGVYDVRMTVPGEYVLGATGREVDRVENGDGTTTHHYRQEDVHGFAWTASPSYQVREAQFRKPGLPPIDMRLLIQPEHAGQAERHFEAARAAFEHYGRWYGPYPYGHVTLVDPAWGSGAAGMEYPTFFTCGTRWLNPRGDDSPEGVTIHEAGHQFWYGIVGNDEFSHAWLDEGLNTFSTIRTLEQAYEPRVLVHRYLSPWKGQKGLFPVSFPDIEVSRWLRRTNRYRDLATRDTPSRPTWRYLPKAASSLSYDKTALWLATLERHLGWDTLQAILSTFFERYSFRHPTPEDFFAVADEVSGQDLGWFFDQVYRGSDRFDYAVSSVKSVSAEPDGWVEQDGAMVFVGAEGEEDDDEDEDEAGPYRSEILVRRKGGGVFPVEVLMKFEDGHEVRETWDGRERWKLFVVEREAKIEYAEVDPRRVLMLDTDRINNSRLRESSGELASTKWSSKWMIWLQDLVSTFAFFV